MSNFEFYTPTHVYFGRDTQRQVGDLVRAQGCKKVLVHFGGQSARRSGLLDQIEASLDAAGVAHVQLGGVVPNPHLSLVYQGIDLCKKEGVDFILAVGGGSAMDTAKLASILVTDEYTVKDLLDDPLRGKKTVTTCFIPTTAGTGSEATPNAIVAVPEKELKIGIVNPAMVPDYVVLDARMIKNLPRKIAAASGVDAMAHAIECFTSNKANPFSDTFALDAFDRILNNIERACDDPEALDAKREMQIAAFYGGIAITCSGTTAVHALSYPLGGKYHIAHGVSNAILLMPVMRFNEPAIRHKLALAYDRAVHGEKTCVTDEEKSAWVIERMGEIVKHLDIPTNLSQWNVSRDDLEPLVEAGMSVQRLLVNNMRTVTPEDARNIYLQIL